MEEKKAATNKKPWIPKEHPWKWRLGIGILMFSLAFLGVGITLVKQKSAWSYWRFLAGLYAVLSLILSAHLKNYSWKDSVTTVWHEIIHWVGLILSIGLLSNMVHLGILSPFGASLQAITLLSLATFLAGVYIEKTFLFIGGVMGCFALVLSYVSIYSYLFAIPLALLFFVAFYWFVRNKSHKDSLEKKL